jgi:site-specific recombinase XerD
VRLWAHTKDLRLIHGVMGHAMVETAEQYAKLSSQDVLAAIERAGTVL